MSNQSEEQEVFRVNGVPVAKYFPRQAICVTLLVEADLTYGEARNLFDWLKEVLGSE